MIKFFIQPHEFNIEVTRSRGPGGQNVNRTNSGVILRWSPFQTVSFSPEQRERLIARLKDQITVSGDLVIRADEFRSQEMNKDRAIEKLYAILVAALHVQKKRRKTRPTRSSVEKRHKEKKRRSDTKKLRGGRIDYE